MILVRRHTKRTRGKTLLRVSDGSWNEGDQQEGGNGRHLDFCTVGTRSLSSTSSTVSGSNRFVGVFPLITSISKKSDQKTPCYFVPSLRFTVNVGRVFLFSCFSRS